MSTSDLCVACGLCCDGTIFSFISISEPEAEALTDAPVQVDRANGRTSMRLGCTALKNKCCTIYERRPSGCREYFCAIVKDMEAGKKSFDESLAIVQRIQREVLALNAVLGVPGGGMTAVRDGLAAPTMPWSAEVLDQARATTTLVRTTLLGWT